MIRVGTSHFKSMAAAAGYARREMGIDAPSEALATAEEKVSEGAWHIGAPVVAAGQRIELDNIEGRFFLVEDGAPWSTPVVADDDGATIQDNTGRHILSVATPDPFGGEQRTRRALATAWLVDLINGAAASAARIACLESILRDLVALGGDGWSTSDNEPDRIDAQALVDDVAALRLRAMAELPIPVAFVVEGTDAGGNLSPDGTAAPFAIFDPAAQDWLPKTYASREEAETALREIAKA